MTTIKASRNQFIIEVDRVRILMKRRDGSIVEAVIDPADFELVRGYTWGLTVGYATTQIYKCGCGCGRPKHLIYLHRLLMGIGFDLGHGV